MDQTTRMALLGVCYDESSSFLRGAREAPPAIRQALHSASANLWAENGLTLDGRSLEDFSDLTPGSCEEMRAQVEQSLDGILGRGLRPIVLGGDHSITYPIIRSMAKKYPDLTLLHFDAHPDIVEYNPRKDPRNLTAMVCAKVLKEIAAKMSGYA